MYACLLGHTRQLSVLIGTRFSQNPEPIVIVCKALTTTNSSYRRIFSKEFLSGKADWSTVCGVGQRYMHCRSQHRETLLQGGLRPGSLQWRLLLDYWLQSSLSQRACGSPNLLWANNKTIWTRNSGRSTTLRSVSVQSGKTSYNLFRHSRSSSRMSH